MQFEDIWQRYDLTEAELTGMEWRSPLQYVLHVNYYWDLADPDGSAQVATEDQPVEIVLEACTQLNVHFDQAAAQQTAPSNFGTIVGWGRVDASPWLQAAQLTPSEWLHLFFQIGGGSRIEALCRSISVRRIS
jgi:hypothetical protein